MRSRLLGPERKLADSVWLNAMAAVAVGMFVGYWVIGPTISGGEPIEHAPLRSAKLEREMLKAAAARPDPSPYRTRTPAFDVPDASNFGMVAKQQAQAVLGGRAGNRDAISEPEVLGDASLSDGELPSNAAPSGRYRQVDRHTGVAY
jgi:hypothetical protein